MGSASEFFKGKTITVTGVTGFLGKVFVEKILRIQPNIKRLYLIIRASDSYSAAQRLHYEVFGVELFKIQREKLGAEFGSFISEKVVAVPGDVSFDMFGLKDQTLIDEMLTETNIIVHSAATTKLDERYDVAIDINTMGAYNTLNFAKRCCQLETILQVSTAYVSREKKEPITEEPIHMNDHDKLITSTSILDMINLEKHLIEDKLSALRAQNATEKTITSTMRDFGMSRANLHGWPHTYAFAKAMGELLLISMKDNIPLIIARPSCITSTHSKPFPGWIEGVRTMDFVFVEYFKGRITSFVGHPETIFDLVPVDMVVNSMIIALVAHSKNSSETLIYHIGTSFRNPVTLSYFQDIMYCFVANSPWQNKYRKQGMARKTLTYYPTLEFGQNKALGRTIQGARLEKVANLYKAYTIVSYVFEDRNAEMLRMTMKKTMGLDEEFNFDPKSIDWKDYLMNIHFPGLMKYPMMKYSLQSKM